MDDGERERIRRTVEAIYRGNARYRGPVAVANAAVVGRIAYAFETDRGPLYAWTIEDEGSGTLVLSGALPNTGRDARAR